MTRLTSMTEKVERYLQLRRALGYQLRIEGRLLQQFAAFADAAGHRGPLTTELALQGHACLQAPTASTGRGVWKSSAALPGIWHSPNRARKCRRVGCSVRPTGEQRPASTRMQRSPHS